MPLSNEGRPIQKEKKNEKNSGVDSVSMPLSNEGRPIQEKAVINIGMTECLDAPIQWRKANSLKVYHMIIDNE